MIWIYILCFVLGAFMSFCAHKISQNVGRAIEADTEGERRGKLAAISSWIVAVYSTAMVVVAIALGLAAWGLEKDIDSVDARVTVLEEVITPADTIKVVDYVGGEDSK